MPPAIRARDAARWLVAGSRVMVGGALTLSRMARRGELREVIRPWMRFGDVSEVPFELFVTQGARAVLFDLENTLIPPGGPFNEEGRAIVRRVRELGMQVGVVTNCSAAWARDALEAEQIPYIAPAHKPASNAFMQICRTLGVKPSQAVYVGDQMITDVFGAQRTGMRAVLLEPRYDREAMSSRFQRLVSKGLLRMVGGPSR